jgi:uncharacterized FAD-dependent dehydrogenase
MKIGIIGSGPAGMILAHELMDIAQVWLFERGEDIDGRLVNPSPNVTEGFGGAGAFSDGKFNLSPLIGNRLTEILPSNTIDKAIKEADSIFMRFGAPEGSIKMSDYPESFRRSCRENGFSLIHGSTRHWGSDVGQLVVKNIYEMIRNKVNILTNTEAKIITPNKVRYSSSGRAWINQDFDLIIVAVGRSGADFMSNLYEDGKFPHLAGATDIGIRYECPNEVFEEFYQWSYEPKISIRSSFDERVRLFCSCLKDGVVALENYVHLNIACVNGHGFSPDSGVEPSGNANFAVLVTTQFTEPFNDPVTYCNSICKTANTLAGGGVLMQTYSDFKKGRRSTIKRILENGVNPSFPEAVAGDLSYVIPYRQMMGISEFIEALEGVFPGVKRGIMYFPEVKMYSQEANINHDGLHYQGIPSVYPVGDCSGWTRSLAGAAAHALLVAQKIKEKIHG